jgi:hypothetical protein
MKSNTKRIRTEASNPTGPTEPSVQVLQNNRKSISSTTTHRINLKVESDLFVHTRNYEMRDLYHRQKRLQYWIQRVNTDLQDPDRADVLKLVEYMQDRDRAILWITRCITALLLIRRQLEKPFREATKGSPMQRYIVIEDKCMS